MTWKSFGIISGSVFFAMGIWLVLMDYQYMGITFITMWAPTLWLVAYALPKMTPWNRASTGVLVLLGFDLCVVVEYLGTQFDFWDFSQAQDKLLPWRICHIPLEEFSFWFSGCAQIVLLYASIAIFYERKGFKRGSLYRYLKARVKTKDLAKTYTKPAFPLIWLLDLIPKLLSSFFSWFQRRPAPKGVGSKPAKTSRGFFQYFRGVRFPGWALTVLPFFILGVLMTRKALKRIHALALTNTLLFCIGLYLLMEANGICRGHWVWNEAKMLGPKLGVIPIEELFLYVTTGLFFAPLYEMLSHFLLEIYGSKQERLKAARQIGEDLDPDRGQISAELAKVLGV